ncbi:hypothetical protein [Paenibacillus sp. JDR-2]|uniref:hypothetical protein n=1 Tax=Paenibacillus sp. (strain JDR-2) TaxID=324057 RepID=UPI000166A6E0|nr:hypothetical protein [Paenibacillus sp. JDR-2]ACT00227.1 hypothetical protein Pjdr2_1555 [Paenibacillus sp. JDR-2]
MAWITPKIDWLSTNSINAEDFNRIENNIKEVAAYLNSIQYTMPSLTTVTNRTQSYVDFLSSIKRIEQNLEAIRAAFITPAGYPGTKAWGPGVRFNWEDANRLETNVKLLMDFGVLVYQSFRYCGAAICGETFVLYPNS